MAIRTLLVISNGHGEDSIGAEIVRRLPKSIQASAYPTLGDGRAYERVCPIVGPRRHLPSEGQRRRGSLWRDMRAGFGIGPATHFMRTRAKDYDAILVVGDLLGIIMCRLSGNRARIYLDVYKSGFANRYSALERWVIDRTCDLVLTRDAVLAAQLKHGRFVGNVMMDTLAQCGYDAKARRRHPRAIAILPGSRAAAPRNFGLQVAALRQVKGIAEIDLFLSLAPGSDLAELASAAGLAVEGDMLTGDGLVIHASSGTLGDVLEASDLVLGQAGTANLQALGLGKPVVSFLAEEARETRRRRIAALTGDSRIVTERTPDALAEAISALMADETDRLRRGAIGRARIGPPGAIDAVIAELSE